MTRKPDIEDKADFRPIQTKQTLASPAEGAASFLAHSKRNPGKVSRSHDEEILQRQLVACLRLARPSILFFHVPNGGARSASEGVRFKAMGVLAGVADLAFVSHDGRAFFLELKAKGGRQSPAQADFEHACMVSCAPYAVASSLDEALAIVRGWFPEVRFPRA